MAMDVHPPRFIWMAGRGLRPEKGDAFASAFDSSARFDDLGRHMQPRHQVADACARGRFPSDRRSLPTTRVPFLTDLAGDRGQHHTFAALALTLAAIGLYGVLAYTVTLRRRESASGPRSARAGAICCGWSCGRASPRRGAGLALGMALSIGAAWLMRSLLFGIEPLDGTVVRGQLRDAGPGRAGGLSRPGAPCRGQRSARLAARVVAVRHRRDPPVAKRRRRGLTPSDSCPAAGSAARTARRPARRQMRTPRRRTSGRRSR